jgi:hypothetical protein
LRNVFDPTTTRLLRDVSAGIRVLQIRDGVMLSESQILDRARNIVMGIIGNYRLEAIHPGVEAGEADAYSAETWFGALGEVPAGDGG